jgi:hypothetical protein
VTQTQPSLDELLNCQRAEYDQEEQSLIANLPGESVAHRDFREFIIGIMNNPIGGMYLNEFDSKGIIDRLRC